MTQLCLDPRYLSGAQHDLRTFQGDLWEEVIETRLQASTISPQAFDRLLSDLVAPPTEPFVPHEGMNPSFQDIGEAGWANFARRRITRRDPRAQRREPPQGWNRCEAGRGIQEGSFAANSASIITP
jgi:hypothetical protein